MCDCFFIVLCVGRNCALFFGGNISRVGQIVWRWCLCRVVSMCENCGVVYELQCRMFLIQFEPE